MSLILEGNLFEVVGGGGILSTATEWWHAGAYSGTTATGQKGSVNLTASGSPSQSDDGTYYMVPLASASSQYLDGGDNFDAVGDFSVVNVCGFNTLSGTRILVAKRSGGDNGWNMHTSGTTPTCLIDAGPPTSKGGAAVSTSGIYGHGFGRDGTTQWIYEDGGTWITTTCSASDLSNSEAFRIGRGSGSTEFYSDIDWYGSAVFVGTNLSETDVSDAVAAILTAAEM